MNRSTDARSRALPLVFGMLAFALVLAGTRPIGPGLDPDAMSYLTAARTLVSRGELLAPEMDWDSPDSTTPLAHFPPGFPIAVAAPHALGADPITAARLVMALGASVTGALSIWLMLTEIGWGAALLLTVTLLVTPAIVDVHLAVLSEPLFLACLVAALACMVRQRGASAGSRPWLAGIPAALGGLVRYAGISVAAAAVLWAAAQPGRWRDRLRAAALAALPMALLFGAWVWRTTRVAGRGSIRRIAVYGQLTATLHEGASTLRSWLAPMVEDRLASLVLATAVLATLIWLIAGAARAKRLGDAASEGDLRAAIVADPPAATEGDPRRILAAAGVLAVSYVSLVLLARLVADPGIPLDERLLAPAILLVEIGAVAAAGAWWRSHGIWSRAVVTSVALLWGVLSAAQSWQNAVYATDTGIDYADRIWRDSPLVAWARTAGGGRPLFSNFPAALYFYAARGARLLPQSADPRVLAAFADTLARRNGIVLVFARTSAFVRPAGPLIAQLGLQRVAELADGAVYRLPADTLPLR